jgi:hypothetical protein
MALSFWFIVSQPAANRSGRETIVISLRCFISFTS